MDPKYIVQSSKGLVCRILVGLVLVAGIATPALADYQVTYGAENIPGRVYDSNANTTTYTYTVTGDGQGGDTAKLKAFMLQVPACQPPLEVVSVSPDLADGDEPPFAPTNPAFFFSDPDLIFSLLGIRWHGWHGLDGLPAVLVPYDGTRAFSVTFAGNIQEGPIQAGTWFWETSDFVVKYKYLPGPSCETVCANRKVINFNQFADGTVLAEQLAAQGIHVTATNNNASNPQSAIILDTAVPTGDTDLGTKNTSFGGPGLPSLNAITGAGVGNYLEQLKALAISGSASETQSEDAGGTITFSFDLPARIIAASFIDITSKAILVGKNGGTQVFSQYLPALGENSLQTVALSDVSGEVTEFSVVLSSEGAIDDLTICADEPTPTPTPTPSETPTPTPTPECDDQDITEEQFILDGNAGAQKALVRRAANKLKRLATTKAQRKLARKAIVEAEARFLNAWTVTWSMPSVATVCENVNEFCVESDDNSVAIQSYTADSDWFLSTTEQLVQELITARGNSKPADQKLIDKANDLHASNVKTTAEIPGVTTVCPDGSQQPA